MLFEDLYAVIYQLILDSLGYLKVPKKYFTGRLFLLAKRRRTAFNFVIYHLFYVLARDTHQAWSSFSKITNPQCFSSPDSSWFHSFGDPKSKCFYEDPTQSGQAARSWVGPAEGL